MLADPRCKDSTLVACKCQLVYDFERAQRRIEGAVVSAADPSLATSVCWVTIGSTGAVKAWCLHIRMPGTPLKEYAVLVSP